MGYVTSIKRTAFRTEALEQIKELTGDDSINYAEMLDYGLYCKLQAATALAKLQPEIIKAESTLALWKK